MATYFMRHGQSQANAEHVFAGQSDSPLTTLGREQAIQEAQRLRVSGQTFDVIVSSPLVRAYDTAVIIAETIGYPIESIHIDPRLMERDFGSLQDTSNIGRSESDLEGVAGVESIEAFAARSQAAIYDNVATYMGMSVLFVSHAGVGMVMKTIARKGDLYSMRSGPELPNAQVFALEVDPVR